MLPTWVLTLKSFAPTLAPQLVAAAVVAGVVWLFVPDQRLVIAAFVVERAIILVLPWPEVSDSHIAVSLLTWLAVALVFAGSVWAARARGAAMPRPFRLNALLRAAAAALAVLFARWFVRTYASLLPPALIAFTSVWLIAHGLLGLLLAGSGLGVGVAVLTFTDGCRALYGLTQPDLWVWAVWCIGDIFVAWAAGYLSYAEASASPRRLQDPR